jgi:hypothetical protein
MTATLEELRLLHDGGKLPYMVDDRDDKNDRNDNPYTTRQEMTKDDSQMTGYDRFVGNLTEEITAYIQDMIGTFSDADIDHQFGLTHRRDKQARSAILKKLYKKNLIKKDLRVAGKWHILSTEAEWVDLLNTPDNYFPLQLPLGLADMVNIPPKSIIVIAGSSNAGKTALAMKLLHDNLTAPFQRLYLMSEMGPSEYRQRVARMTDDLPTWGKCVRAASVTAGFAGLITHHNPDGMTIVDYLEEVEGEYYRIASDIRSIYDSLAGGIAVVCLQKHSRARVGRGGEGTTEKARLYLTIDTLVNSEDATISAIKVIKAKDYPDMNPNGKEVHVAIGRQGTTLVPITRWHYANEVQREAAIKGYERQIEQGKPIIPKTDKEPALEFQTDAGRIVRITEKQVLKWQDEYDKVDVAEVLGKMAVDSYDSPFLKDKGYFFQIGNTLARKQERGS